MTRLTTRLALVASVAFLWAVSGSVLADREQDPRERLEDFIKAGEVAATTASGEVADPAAPRPPPAWVDNEETLGKYHEALQAYFDYRARGLEHRKDVFAWQLFSAKLIFCIVLVVVGTGIALAIIQFRAELEQVRKGKATGMTRSELEASVQGVKVSSSIVGIIILTLSLAFFYFYLVHIYPIEDIF